MTALREGKTLADPQLDAVRRFAHAVAADQGNVPEEEVEQFLAAGFGRRQVLDIMVGVAMKTLSNYTNHIAHTPLDPAWQAQEWSRA